MSSVTDEELHNLMGPGGGAKKRVVKKKKIPMIGHLGRRRRLLRNSNNLRFKEVYKPITPTVAFCFLFVAGSIWAFLNYVVIKPKK
ncbi:hypothetical protein TrCOL_g11581 [Triparma columacea]|uniref:Uncharacterized protein n=1 Tax=Triparma columacea TaxID=722753 RepID=A0A9W7G636_9STRA|nr:hypothetical protein TrCOL_g11581 [Triparma columacea]